LRLAPAVKVVVVGQFESVLEGARLRRLRNSTLLSLLGGAAVYRCDNSVFSMAALAAGGTDLLTKLTIV
jgi:hypothetical protein